MNTSAIVIDNFTLQDVGEALVHGISDDDRAELRCSTGQEGYEIIKVPSVGIQIEGLLQVLNAIILHDQLFVEKANTDSWEDAKHLIQPLRDEHVIVAKPFSEARDEWLPTRLAVEEAICFSPKLAEDFRLFRKGWKPGVQHPVFSTLLWGTAGMIARSQFLKMPYLSHPSRCRVIELGPLGAGCYSGQDVFNKFITTERIKLYERATCGLASRAVSLTLPPLALEVIEECRTIDELIPTAIQLRQKYSNLREWIGEYQQAIQSNPATLAKKMAVLEAAASDVERQFNGVWWAQLSLNINLSLTHVPQLKTGLKVPVGATIQRLLPKSVRTAVAKLIQSSWSNSTLDRTFKLLGVNSPKLRAQAMQRFQDSP